MTRPPTNDRDLESEFDAFRQERNLRRQQRADPLRGLGSDASVLREIDQAEMEEARERQLSNDMLDFFTAAKRKAAGIVRHVTEVAEEEASGRISQEVEEFLSNLIERATAFMQFMDLRRGTGTGNEKHIEPDMHNLVGRLLDEFRNEGTAQLGDKHLGQDPFKTDVDAVAAELRAAEERSGESGLLASPSLVDPLAEAMRRGQSSSKAAVAPAPVTVREGPPKPRQSIENHLVAEVHGAAETEAEVHPLIAWLGRDIEKVGAVLRVLVQHDLIAKDEARVVYQALLS